MKIIKNIISLLKTGKTIKQNELFDKQLTEYLGELFKGIDFSGITVGRIDSTKIKIKEL